MNKKTRNWTFLSYLTQLCCLFFWMGCASYHFRDLAQHEFDGNTKEILRFLNNSPDPYIRAQAAHSLGRLRAEEAVPALIQKLTSPYWTVRYYCADSLGKIGDERAVLPLRGQLSVEENIHVRGSLMEALSLLS